MGNLFDELRRVFPDAAPATCRKIGHLTMEAAEAQLASIRSSPDCEDGDGLRVYRCTNCSQLHVGHAKDAPAVPPAPARGEPVRDERGREIAPAQDAYERPRGPWNDN